MKISRPKKKGEIRLTGLEPSTTEAEIIRTIAIVGECKTEEVQLGPLRTTARGLGAVWVRCPLRTAVKLGKEGKVKIG